MVQVRHAFLETLYDLSYLAGLDELHGKVIEDSRELFVMLKEWATEFEDKYPLTDEQMGDFSIVHGIDYLTAIDNFYAEKRDELMGTNLNIKEPDEFYYKIVVHKVKNGYSFMVSSPNELEDEVILDLAVLKDLFENEEDSDCAEVDCLVDETDIEVFRQSGRLHRI